MTSKTGTASSVPETNSRLMDRLFYPVRCRLPYRRPIGIALRTLHLAAISILVGGHAFHAPAIQLQPCLYGAIVTGLLMAALESYPNLHFFVEGAGVLMWLKLGLICAIPFAWSYRFPILLVVLALASVGSHMSARFRHYSFLYGSDVLKSKCSNLA